MSKVFTFDGSKDSILMGCQEGTIVAIKTIKNEWNIGKVQSYFPPNEGVNKTNKYDVSIVVKGNERTSYDWVYDYDDFTQIKILEQPN